MVIPVRLTQILACFRIGILSHCTKCSRRGCFLYARKREHYCSRICPNDSGHAIGSVHQRHPLTSPTPCAQSGMGKRRLFRTAWRRRWLCGRCRCGRRSSCCWCWGRCRLDHWSSKASFIFFLTDLLYFRILERDDAAGASILYFHRATFDVINVLCVIRIARLWIRHLVI